MATNPIESGPDLISLTADIASAYLAHNAISAGDVPGLIESTHGALDALVKKSAEPEKPVPAVDPAKSVKRDGIISLIDGKEYKMLKRHLAINGMTPDEYREAYGLRSDYPMVAPSYSEKRRDLAKKIGLGRKPGS